MTLNAISSSDDHVTQADLYRQSVSFDHHTEDDLYQLLGDAWYAQFDPNGVQACELATSIEIGKCEFKAMATLMRPDWIYLDQDSLTICVAATIRMWGGWKMPAGIVAALACKRRFAHAAAAAE